MTNAATNICTQPVVLEIRLHVTQVGLKFSMYILELWSSSFHPVLCDAGDQNPGLHVSTLSMELQSQLCMALPFSFFELSSNHTFVVCVQSLDINLFFFLMRSCYVAQAAFKSAEVKALLSIF